jgi:hypothetical protein
MGWWGASEEGHSLQPDSEIMWGDAPADILDNALDEIDKAFKSEVGRLPTQTELKSGLLFALGGGSWLP